MPLEKTEVIILKMFNWSESSRTVVFFSRRYGKLVLIDKGGRSFKAKRGRLQPFAQLEVTFYSSEKESSGYISDVDLLKMFSFEKDGTLGRLAYASAACELLNVLLPEEQAHSELFSYFINYLDFVNEIDKQALPAIFVTFFLRTISFLGYHPSFRYCSGCRKEIIVENGNSENNKPSFKLSPERGGVVCETCQKPGDYYIPLSPESLRLLQVLQAASLSETAGLPIGYHQAALLLETLEKIISYQADLKSQLKSLEFLEKLKNSQLN